MGRKKTYDEETMGRFVLGTFERIAAVLCPGESRAEFIREAVERELKRRERKKLNGT